MGETTREIEAQIDRSREELASNIRELDRKVRSAADWKEHFNAHPAVAIGVAFGGGLLLGSLVPSRTFHQSGMTYAMSDGNGQANGYPSYEMAEPAPPSVHRQQAKETWDIMKGALLGLATARLTQVIDEMIPGFRDEVQRVQGDRRPS
jgi:hypothetical protein